MRVAVNKARQDQRAFGFDRLLAEDRPIRQLRKTLADGNDGIALDDHVSVLDDAAVRIHGDNRAAGDQEIDEIGRLCGGRWLSLR